MIEPGRDLFYSERSGASRGKAPWSAACHRDADRLRRSSPGVRSSDEKRGSAARARARQTAEPLRKRSGS